MILEAATLPIRGQQRFRSNLECGQGMRRSSSLAGAISHARRLVSSKPEASESKASTHMYNCRRALEDSQYLGIAKRANIVHLTPMTGGPFILRPCRWSLLQLSYEWSLAHLVHGYGLQTVVLSQKWRLDGEKVTSKPSKRYLATHTAPGQSSRPAPYSDSSY